MAWATDWDSLFGRSAPLILEIGFGYGTFLTHLARTNPNANVVGIEIANRCLDAAERAVSRERLTNVRIIHARAETALHHLFRPQTISDVYINFPDPWFKSGHVHRRLMQRDTLDALVSRMQTGARLFLATDIADYAEMSAELLAETPQLENALSAPYIHDPNAADLNRVITKYEAKAREAGRTCYYFVYRRNSISAPDIPVIEELPMPHVVFTSPLSLDAMIESFEPRKLSIADEGGEPTHINYLAAYVGQTRTQPTALFEVHISEPTIEQRIALMLLAKFGTQSTYTLQLGSLGHARPTAGVHRAVRVLSEWLIGLHPDARLIDSKLQGDSGSS